MHTNATFNDEPLELHEWTPCEISGHRFQHGQRCDCGEAEHAEPMTYEQLSDEEKADLNNSLMGTL